MRWLTAYRLCDPCHVRYHLRVVHRLHALEVAAVECIVAPLHEGKDVCNTAAFVGGGVHGRSFSRSMMCEFMAETARTPPAVSWAADIYRASEPPAREEGYRT